MQRDAFAVSDRLAALITVKPGEAGSVAAIDSAFAPLISDAAVADGLPRQLYQIAKLIAGNATVQGNRQIFLAQLGCFHAAMKGLALSDAVTAFTQRDFGRTFTLNNRSGADHAWGNNHPVIGGAVNGGLTYGTCPRRWCSVGRTTSASTAGSCRAAGSRPARSTGPRRRC